MPVVIYGIDGANNKVETLTKEQILDAIAQAQLGGSVLDYDSAFVSQLKEINHGYALKFWIGTQAEYNALQSHEVNVIYIISDDNSKEEILAAIDTLSHSLDGVNAALAAKQDLLTFDAAPTQNSTNPVTSGGVYTAIDNAKVKRTVLWEKTAQNDVPYKNGDSITLSDDVSNYDRIEVYLGNPASVGATVCYGIQTFDANIGSFKITWVEPYIMNDSEFTIFNCELMLSFSNTTVTVYGALKTRANFYPAQTYVTSTLLDGETNQRIYKIVGVKLP